MLPIQQVANDTGGMVNVFNTVHADGDLIELNDLPLATALATCEQNVANSRPPGPHRDIDVLIEILRIKAAANRCRRGT